MPAQIFSLIAAVAVLLCARGAGAAPLEVYGRLPHIEDIALSPDGTRVAFVRTEGDARVLAVVALESGALLGTLHAGDEKLRGVDWADDGHVIIRTSVATFPRGPMFTGQNVREWFQAQVYDLKAGKSFVIPPAAAASDLTLMNIVGGALSVRRFNDHTVIFVPGVQMREEVDVLAHRLKWQGGRALLGVSLDTQTSRLVAPGRPNNLRWVVDPDGEVAAEETYDQSNGRWSILIRREGRMQEAAAGTGLIEFPLILGLGPTAETLLVSSVEGEEPVWRLLSREDGSLSAPMAERRTLERPIEDRATHRMIGGVHIADSEEYVFFDPAIEQSWQAIVRAFPNEHVRFESAAADFRKVIVRVEGERDGYCFELVNLSSHHAEALGDVYEGIKPLEVRRISYAAGDGLEIPAYLTLPHGKPARKLPLIVLPHGGPAARDTADFDWWSQALADQGYAVLRPNYRGSDIGRAFLARGFGEWGRKMQTDLSDGVRYLVHEGIADPARVCIVGASYGGYAALAGVSLEGGVYRCAVAFAGISDIHRMLNWVNDRQHASSANRPQRYWDRFMGLSGPDDPMADAISPLRHVGGIKVPVLLIHGKDDTVVPFEQSQLMYDALRKERQDVQLVTLKEEDHWLSRGATRLQMLETSVAFLRAHNPPDP